MGAPDYVIVSVDFAILPPLLLPLVKDHLRITFSTDDEDLKLKIAGAIRIYEHKTGLRVNPTVVAWAPVLNDACSSYAAPLQPVTTFIATDVDDVVVTDEYEIRAASLTSPNFMVRKDGAAFPAGTGFDLTAGFATADAIFADMLMSIFRITATLYEYRQTVDATAPELMPLWMDDLLVGTWVPRC